MKKRKTTEQEWNEFTLKAIRSVDYPWNLTLEGWYHTAKAEKRVGTKANLEATNQKRQRETTIKYKAIRNFAKQVIADNPKLQQASPNLLAKKIFKLKPGWSRRTIRRALTPSK